MAHRFAHRLAITLWKGQIDQFVYVQVFVAIFVAATAVCCCFFLLQTIWKKPNKTEIFMATTSKRSFQITILKPAVE